MKNSGEYKGIIIKSLAGFYYVEAGGALFECKARGIFRREGETPLTGDNVEISVTGSGKGVIEKIEERKNFLIRPPLANIERLYITVSVDSPKPNFLVIDKITAIAEEKEIEPVIVVTKSDIGDPESVIKIYKSAGFQTFCVSAENGEGIEELKKSFINGINAFTGNSGVGKSSLLNKIIPGLNIPTADISEKLGRGKHTTRHTELYKINGAYLADTAGFSSLDIAKCENVKKENLQFCFREFSPAIGKCRFTGCAHIKDSGCAVKKLTKEGRIAPSRYQSYVSLYNDVKDIKDWER